MTQKEKLLELIHEFGLSGYEINDLVDYLLANGVVILPCKVGDTVYDIYEALNNGGNDVRALKVTNIHIHLDKRNKAWIIIDGYYFGIDDFGKTVFLTHEEAEAALQKMRRR